jgi:hypothetical protein
MITLFYNLLLFFHSLMVKIVGFVEVDEDHGLMGCDTLLTGNLLCFRVAY